MFRGGQENPQNKAKTIATICVSYTTGKDESIDNKVGTVVTFFYHMGFNDLIFLSISYLTNESLDSCCYHHR